MSKQKAGCFNILLFMENYEKSDLLQLMEAGGFHVDACQKKVTLQSSLAMPRP